MAGVLDEALNGGNLGSLQTRAVQGMMMQQLEQFRICDFGLSNGCCFTSAVENAEEAVVELEIDNGHDSLAQSDRPSFRLRLCVHHGRRFNREDTYVEVVLRNLDSLNNSLAEKIHRSDTSKASTCPTWDFYVESPISFTGASVVEIRIMNGYRDSLFPSLSGVAWLTVKQTSQPQREELEVIDKRRFTACCGEQTVGATLEFGRRIVVVTWQVTGSGHSGHDRLINLSRAGELDQVTAARKQELRLTVEVQSLHLRHKVGCQEKIFVKILGARPKKTDVISNKLAIASISKQESCPIDMFTWNDTVVETWSLFDNAMGLEKYDLIFQVWREDDDGTENLGEWHETVSELYDLIRNSDLQLHFRALLHQGNRGAGDLEVTLDIAAANALTANASEHAKPIATRRSELPTRRGKQIRQLDLKASSEGSPGETFYVHVAMLGASEKLSVTRPFLKVISASSISQGISVEAFTESGRCAEWKNAFEVSTTPENSRTVQANEFSPRICSPT